ncbi:hypothetical protein [Aeromicrobium wangtongii]|uniref:Uncharacterized protein n=1 Tax=Aeromicrobium wangtongii TaxID=2969247 RepID=A0ABY5MF52_9ACTN|nr:hypothetical protein [Aeromicrobium wangtongii]MCD9197862.1 hypothetical protein [Aeromicrobium wangtongii]UUP15343.1 hypothetical protein NQV15_08525 [Aeromicrobium wangtongii]
MSQTPSDDTEPDQDAEPPVGAPAPDPGGEPVAPGDASGSDRVDPAEAGEASD